jgi:hypothetical protein
MHTPQYGHFIKIKKKALIEGLSSKQQKKNPIKHEYSRTDRI